MNIQEMWKNKINSTGLKEYDYLHKLEWKYTAFKAANRNDHVHCELCWNKISENANDVCVGYADVEYKYWICPDCYHDFKELFDWSLLNLETE